MSDARRHIEECSGCRLQLQQFEKLHTVLKSAPDFDPPRSIVFSPPARKAVFAWFDWRSVAASMAAAALVAGIAIRLSPALPPTPAVVTTVAPPAIVQTEKIDYGQIINDMRQSERAWVVSELRS